MMYDGQFLSGQFCHFCTPHLLGKRSVDPIGEYLAAEDLERLSEVPGDQLIRSVFISMMGVLANQSL